MFLSQYFSTEQHYSFLSQDFSIDQHNPLWGTMYYIFLPTKNMFFFILLCHYLWGHETCFTFQLTLCANFIFDFSFLNIAFFYWQVKTCLLTVFINVVSVLPRESMGQKQLDGDSRMMRILWAQQICGWLMVALLIFVGWHNEFS